MSRVKIILAVAVFLLIAGAVTAASVSAKDDGFSLSADEVQILNNDKFEYDISVSNADSIDYLSFSVIIPDGFFVKSASVPSEIENLAEVHEYPGKVCFIFGKSVSSPFSGNKTVLKLGLRAGKSVKRGIYRVRITDCTVTFRSGKTVTEPEFGNNIIFKTCQKHTPGGWRVVKNPTYEKEGLREKYCGVCSQTLKKSKIKKIMKREIADSHISYKKVQAYTGKAVKPKLNVEFKGIELIEGVDYTASYSDNKSAGKAKITVKGIGIYTGKRVCTFTIKK